MLLGLSGCFYQNPDWDGAPSDGAEAEQVGADGALVLYRFDEGGGGLVKDTSGLQPPLDLEVPSGFAWTPDGLNIF